MWGCFAGDTVGDLFKIQGTLNQHGNHSTLQRPAIPSGLHLAGPPFVFQQDNDLKHTASPCTGYPTKYKTYSHSFLLTANCCIIHSFDVYRINLPCRK